MTNNVQLITYVDRFGGGSINDLHLFLKEHLSEAFSGVHLLPFFYPIDGRDAGYDPINNAKVDRRLGSWEDIKTLSNDFKLMADMIVNHISAQSPEFLDVIKNGSQSSYFDLFLRKEKVFNEGEEELQEKIFRPGAELPFTSITLDTGESYQFWTTFSENQIDIDVSSEAGRTYIKNTLQVFAQQGIQFVRLDAIGFSIKKAGTSCFMLPETLAFIKELADYCHQLGMQVLLEVHASPQIQAKAANQADYIYDFVFPPLALHAFVTRSFVDLAAWLNRRPKNCVNVLDTHDGIGVNDAEGVLPDEALDLIAKQIHKNTGGISEAASGGNAENLDVTHINSSFYDAMGHNDADYIAARAIQLFLPGIPQVYYGGLLAMPNDEHLLRETGVGRDVNRPYLSFEEIKEQFNKPVVQNVLSVISHRQQHKAFEGSFNYSLVNDSVLELFWKNKEYSSTLTVDLAAKKTTITYSDNGQEKKIIL